MVGALILYKGNQTKAKTNQMFLVGLTGGIASGKSTVATMIEDFGIPIIDADKIARDVVTQGKPAWKKIKKEFGESILLANGEIDRAALGKIIFNDASNRAKLNSITHPEIFKLMMWNCFKLAISGQQCVVLDIPLLFETRRYLPFLSYIIVVNCSPEQQIYRLNLRNGYSEEEAVSRMQSQMNLAEKCKHGNFIVENSGNIEDTKQQVGCIVQDLRDCNTHLKFRLLMLSGVCALGLLTWTAFHWLL
ncbi:Dephospho-CoA kinase domain-containing protein [Nymphon striatum]|nr:Dephospho-CoA kinase domain-containing protein [Nymphon striatum]